MTFSYFIAGVLVGFTVGAVGVCIMYFLIDYMHTKPKKRKDEKT